MTADVRLTRIKKHGGALLCKRIVLGEDGRPKSDGSPCAMSRGSAERVVFNGTPATELATTILDLGSHEAIVLGDLADGLGDRIQIEKDANADPASGTHGRTRRTFSFRDGVPAACLLDFDQKAMPDDVRERLTAMGGFEGALASLIPGYAGLARVVRASTSSGIYNAETGERFPSSGGAHVYVFVKDGSDIDRFLDTLEARAWNAGLGWILVANRGALLIRSIVDTSVGLPERLVFEGPPEVIHPLRQDHAARMPEAREGELLDTRAACPPLSAAEERSFKQLVAAAKLALKPQADAAIETAAEEIAVERGIKIEAAREVVCASLNGELTSADILEFDDGSVVSVAEVLSEPERYHGRTLADPLEGPAYGRGKAKIFRNANGSVIVNSFAHGGTVYRLRHDAAYIEAKIAAAGEAAPFVLAGLMPDATGLDAVARERLRNRAAKVGKASRTAVKAVVEEAIAKARREALEAFKVPKKQGGTGRRGTRGR